ncbi:hypothetical protein SAMN04489726_2855 [Allokutzneria albata]|uniref:Uncharacterized protein n=2 Tax=Allokutzneria albata TaxID=211114 RepID=A0A1G9V659_ALLAB|nr:hypothetical protein SAMN04489726_2855 [Allokutzneria albata]
MFLAERSYRQHVTLVDGCDLGNQGGILLGFSEWLALRGDLRSVGPHWSHLVLQVASQELGRTIDPHAGEEDERLAIDALFDLLREFLTEASTGRDRVRIISRYALREREMSRNFPPGLTASDVSLLVNCMNETLEALEDWEFSTRVGADKAQVKAMMDRLRWMAQGDA